MTQSGWYVIHTNPRCEERALQGLAAAGLEAYAPRSQRWRWCRAGGKRIRKRVEGRAFPRYIFIRADGIAQWGKIHSTDGVAGIVCMGTVPVRVPCRVVEVLQVAEDMGQFDFTAGAASTTVRIEAGTRVTISTGPLNGYTATVTKSRDVAAGGNIGAELQFLGRKVPVVIPLTAAEIVA